jgi:hypothetical protein
LSQVYIPNLQVDGSGKIPSSTSILHSQIRTYEWMQISPETLPVRAATEDPISGIHPLKTQWNYTRNRESIAPTVPLPADGANDHM